MRFIADDENPNVVRFNVSPVEPKTCPRCGGPTVTTWIEYDRGDGWLTRVPGTYDCALGAACPGLNMDRPEPSIHRY